MVARASCPATAMLLPIFACSCVSATSQLALREYDISLARHCWRPTGLYKLFWLGAWVGLGSGYQRVFSRVSSVKDVGDADKNGTCGWASLNGKEHGCHLAPGALEQPGKKYSMEAS